MSETRLDPEAVRRYLERWKAVNELEIAELRATPADVKLRQLDALRGLLEHSDRGSELQREDEAARGRWAQLRKALGA
jgi:hypothetical protein